jgi:adenylate cyclase
MGIEIERKFLVLNDDWKKDDCKKDVIGVFFRQGYLASGKPCTVRVRLVGDKGFVTIKGTVTGISRSEFEYAIPAEDARQMLDTLCQQPLIEKTRYRIDYQGHIWEVDEFHGANQGLTVAEIELASETEGFAKPQWLGKEVSADPRYFNSSLVKHPFSEW